MGMKRKIVIAALAHVDAGKTTLAEALLYIKGNIRKLGRVDHKDTFLDTNEQERARGITIFSKQAVLSGENLDMTLLDTPGHVDFSAEMERTLQVLDYAILVVSGSEGVQGHTETLWKLLQRYNIPTFIFVNKMDLDGASQERIMEQFKKMLSDGCVNFSETEVEVWMEEIAIHDERILNQYLEKSKVQEEDISELINQRKVFPCYFGSALKLIGVRELIQGIERYGIERSYPKEFGARVYKIARDEQGNRLTYMKVTGGTLRVKMPLSNKKSNSEVEVKDGIWEEKIDQIRIYSGTKYDSVNEIEAGSVCAVTGLTRTYPGEGLGMEAEGKSPALEPILNYQIILPPQVNAFAMLAKLRLLEEEDPMLRIVWSEQFKEIHAQLMGEVQVEILQNLIKERFGVAVTFGQGNIVYKESVLEPVVGIGHYEPLRHYAEVHLLLEPGEQGSGIQVDTICHEDILDRNWQHAVLSHILEKEHVGVLTGSAITDLKITLLTGRAHLKHTEGGDFRQATYRAIRHGLKSANSVLLEPYYKFRLEIPTDAVGRAMSDIQRMNGNFDTPHLEGDMSILHGDGPVATMQGYQGEVMAYTKGRGRFSYELKGYFPCHNAEEVIAKRAYDSEKDFDNPTGSVFCSHGAGFVVDWSSVEEFKHLESGWKKPVEEDHPPLEMRQYSQPVNRKPSYHDDQELEDIFIRTFGPIKNKVNYGGSNLGYENKANKKPLEQQKVTINFKKAKKEYLLVDGYNIIFSWDDLNELAKDNMDGARTKLMDILCNYQGYRKSTIIIVFDAYKVKGGVGSVFDYHNIHVVYTKEAETADQYIEKVTHEMAKEHHVTVATSDALEQMIIMGQGANRLSAKDLKEEINNVVIEIRRNYLEATPSGKAYLKEQFSEEFLKQLEE